MLTMLDLFSGIGGFSLAASWAGGIETVAFCEIEPYCQKVLKKHWPDVPIFEDITKLRGEDVGAVELICGGPPCQPASCAGKRRGAEDDRWLWPEAIRLVREIHPRWCVFENPTGILTLNEGLAFEHLLLELEAEGYEVQPVIIPACAIGAPHRRDRVWIVACSQGRDDRRIPGKIQKQDEQQTKKRPQTWSAEFGGASQTVTDSECIGYPSETTWKPNSDQERNDTAQKQGRRAESYEIEPGCTNVSYPSGELLQGQHHGPGQKQSGRNSGRYPQSGLGRDFDGLPARLVRYWDGDWERGIPRIASGVPHRVQRIKAMGNAIVPQVAYQILQRIVDIEARRRYTR